MVSVIIPTYNRGNTIKRSIESILYQTYKDFEIIVVDDNSQDETESIVKAIKSDKIKYYRHDVNKGANEARNTGIKYAKGELIAFQDSDDEWLPSKLQKQMDALSQNDVDIVSCAVYRYENNIKEIIPNEFIVDRDIPNKILYGNFISGQTILGKRECFEKNKFDKTLPRMQEWELMIRLSQKYKIHFINEPLVNVFLQSDSISRKPNSAVEALLIIKEKHNNLLNNDKKAMLTILNMLGRYSREACIYNKNYYLQAIKYNKFNVKLYLKCGVYFIESILNKK